MKYKLSLVFFAVLSFVGVARLLGRILSKK